MDPPAHLRIHKPPCSNVCYRTILVDFLFLINSYMSERVMTIIESMVPALEVYSIDEAFADLTGLPGDVSAFGRHMRSTLLKRTGIPVGVGIARTKTL